MVFEFSKYKLAIIAILLVALILRVSGANTILFFEEAEWGMFAQDHTFTNLGLTFYLKAGPPVLWPHNPLVPVLFKAVTIHTTEPAAMTFAMRMVSVVFGMATIILMYFMTKRFYNKKTAVITTGIMAIGYWHLLASLVVDIDGGVLAFLLMLMSYLILLYDEKHPDARGVNRHQKKYLILAGIVFGISLLAKFSAFLLLPVIFIYLLTSKNSGHTFRKRLIQTIKILASVVVIGAAVFSIFPISALLINNPELFLYSLDHAGSYTSFKPTLRPLMVMFVFGTPLLILLSAASVKNWKQNKNSFFLLYVFYLLFMYSFFLGSLDTESTYEKYLMMTIPAMSLLAGDFISRINFSKNNKHLLLLSTIVLFVAMIAMNIANAPYIDHSVPDYQRRAVSGFISPSEWNFSVPLMANVQPGFWMNFYSLAIITMLSVLFFVAAVLKKSKLFFILFLSAALALNVFYLQEFLVHGTHPDINKITYEMADYYKTNYADRPLYANALTLAFYTGKNDDFFVGADDDRKDQALLAKQAGAVMLVTEYYPNIHKDSQAWKNINTCRLEKEFSDKGVIVGRVFIC